MAKNSFVVGYLNVVIHLNHNFRLLSLKRFLRSKHNVTFFLELIRIFVPSTACNEGHIWPLKSLRKDSVTESRLTLYVAIRGVLTLKSTTHNNNERGGPMWISTGNALTKPIHI